MLYIYFFINLVLSLANIGINTMCENDLQVLNGYYHNEEYYLEYGSIYYENGDTNGFIRIKDSENQNLIKEIEYDGNNIEIFKYLAEIDDDSFLVVCEQYKQTNDYEIPTFNQTIILRYDFYGNLLEESVFYEKYIEYHNHNHYLVMIDKSNKAIYLNSKGKPLDNPEINNEYYDKYKDQFQGMAFINGDSVDSINIDYPGIYSIEIKDKNYSFSYLVTIIPKVSIIGEKYQDYYIGEIKIIAKGIIYLNNEEYISDSIIDIPGNYNITIYGENEYQYSRDFTILPKISYFDGSNNFNFKDNLEIKKPIKIYSNGTAILIDGDIYNSEYINKIGHHTLTVYGVSGYYVSLSFTIFPSVSGIEDGKTYDSVNLHIFGNAYLNDELITGDLLLTEPGEYNLNLMFEGDVYKSYSFIINIAEENKEKSKPLYSTIFFIFVISVGGYYIFRKK
ncbi:MAG: hypothetical protein B6I17_03570 [Tenericutes bacterium 4572_104]|nr:MAG: hypothetical protein B6I17_03570 [Tenericutes bacterium 4572_104]